MHKIIAEILMKLPIHWRKSNWPSPWQWKRKLGKPLPQRCYKVVHGSSRVETWKGINDDRAYENEFQLIKCIDSF